MSSFWRRLRQHPIYLRETGKWGEPNPFFATLNRYSSFIIVGTFLLAFCSCGSNFAQYSESNANLVILWGLVCIPNLVMQALTWASIILVPALIAPAVSEEIKRGTWDILRLTPQPMWHILLAKMFGALARLKIWWPMLVFSFLQAAGAIIGLVAVIATGENSGSVILGSLALGLGYILRPWSEVAYAAVAGMLISTLTTSARTALASTYTAVVAMKVLNTSVLWGGLIFLVADISADSSIAIYTLLPVSTYLIATGLLAFWLIRRTYHLDMGYAIAS